MCCEVCYSEFDDGQFQPALLRTCGHSLCLECVVSVIGPSRGTVLRSTYSIKCPKCKQLSEFIGHKEDGKLVLTDFRNKILDQGSSLTARGQRRPCDHEHLAKKKFMCFDRQCSLAHQPFCSYCRKTVHGGCIPGLVILKAEFGARAEQASVVAGLDEWLVETEAAIDRKAQGLVDWLKASLRAQVAGFRKQAEQRYQFSLEKYLERTNHWDLVQSSTGQKLTFVPKTKLDFQDVQRRLERAFLGDVWTVLPLAARASIQGSLDAVPAKNEGSAFVPEPVKNDVCALIDAVALGTKSSMGKYKEIVEGHVPLFQRELNVKAFQSVLEATAEQTRAETASIAKGLTKARLQLVRLRKKCRYRLGETNRKLNNLLWPANRLVVPAPDFAGLVTVPSLSVKAAALQTTGLCYLVSKAELEQVKKMTAGWSSDAKHRLFPKFEVLPEYLLTAAQKKALKRLNAPGGRVRMADFQKLEGELVKHRVPRTVWDSFTAKFRAEATGDPTELEKTVLAKVPHVVLTFDEASKALSPDDMAALKKMAHSGLRFRVRISTLTELFRKSEEEGGQLETQRAEAARLQELTAKRTNELAALHQKLAESKALLRSIVANFGSPK